MWKDRGSAEWCSTEWRRKKREKRQRKDRKTVQRVKTGGTEEEKNIGDKVEWECEGGQRKRIEEKREEAEGQRKDSVVLRAGGDREQPQSPLC